MFLLDGKSVAGTHKEAIKAMFKEYPDRYSKSSLAVVQIGDDDASNTYIRNKRKACEEIGIAFKLHKLSEDVTTQEVLDLITLLNASEDVTGIVVQMPIPKHLDEYEIVNAIKWTKDVDCFTSRNVGNLICGNSVYEPCTPKGVMTLLRMHGIDVSGKRCVVVGRSNIVGKPMAAMLLNKDATVTVCHSKTEGLKEICREADILICSIGKPKFFTKDYIKDGAVVVDVGINRDESGKLCGDVDFEDVKDMDISITPVPGGVGQMTVATLMNNVLFSGMISSFEFE